MCLFKQENICQSGLAKLVGMKCKNENGLSTYVSCLLRLVACLDCKIVHPHFPHKTVWYQKMKIFAFGEDPGVLLFTTLCFLVMPNVWQAIHNTTLKIAKQFIRFMHVELVISNFKYSDFGMLGCSVLPYLFLQTSPLEVECC